MEVRTPRWRSCRSRAILGANSLPAMMLGLVLTRRRRQSAAFFLTAGEEALARRVYCTSTWRAWMSSRPDMLAMQQRARDWATSAFPALTRPLLPARSALMVAMIPAMDGSPPLRRRLRAT